jgi:hypothetical protein
MGARVEKLWRAKNRLEAIVSDFNQLLADLQKTCDPNRPELPLTLDDHPWLQQIVDERNTPKEIVAIIDKSIRDDDSFI